MYEFHDVPIPEAGPGDVVIKVAGAGLCGSDLHFCPPQSLRQGSGPSESGQTRRPRSPPMSSTTSTPRPPVMSRTFFTASGSMRIWFISGRSTRAQQGRWLMRARPPIKLSSARCRSFCRARRRGIRSPSGRMEPVDAPGLAQTRQRHPQQRALRRPAGCSTGSPSRRTPRLASASRAPMLQRIASLQRCRSCVSSTKRHGRRRRRCARAARSRTRAFTAAPNTWCRTCWCAAYAVPA